MYHLPAFIDHVEINSYGPPLFQLAFLPSSLLELRYLNSPFSSSFALALVHIINLTNPSHYPFNDGHLKSKILFLPKFLQKIPFNTIHHLRIRLDSVFHFSKSPPWLPCLPQLFKLAREHSVIRIVPITSPGRRATISA